ncbi:hypothetical protein AMECASPLE_035803, partial [Ameca splendens]
MVWELTAPEGTDPASLIPLAVQLPSPLAVTGQGSQTHITPVQIKLLNYLFVLLGVFLH